jgi:hypothetical protein
MRYFYSGLFAMLLSVTCWADISPKNDPIYRDVWKQYQAGEKSEAIIKCKKVLENPETCNVDKLHFYQTTYIFTGDIEYRKRFDELINKDEKCRDEARIYYN